MFFLYLLIFILIVLLILFVMMAKGFNNKQELHTETPDDYDIPYDGVWIPTKNHRQLHAWRIPAQTECTDISPTLILVHGWNRNVGRMMPYIKALQPRGYNLMVFDARGHGSSDKDDYSSMLKFTEDIEAVLEFVCHQPCVDTEKIGLVGLSIGGAASIFAASRNPKIKAAVTVGAFAHPGDVMRSEIEKRKIPFYLLGWLFFKYVEFRIGIPLEKLAPVNNIAKSNAAILLIHGTSDERVDLLHAERLLAAGQKDKIELWALKDKGHSNCHLEEGFWDRIDEFLKNAFSKS